MALAFTPVDGMSLAQTGQYSQTAYDVVLDTDYPTTGWPISPGEVGLGTVIMGAQMIAQRGVAGAVATTSYVYQFDHVSQKLQVFASGANAGDGLAEAAAGLDALANRTVRIIFFGY